MSFRTFDHLRQDLKYAWRQLRNSKGFAFVAVLTLALGIGANTAIFTLIHAVMLKSLPVTHPNELYRLGDDDNCCVISGRQGAHFSVFSYSLYQYLRDHTPEFKEMAAFQAGLAPVSVARRGDSALGLSFTGELVSGNYFAALGIKAYGGRLIAAADDRTAAAPVAVMSYRAWQQYYGLDSSVIGSRFTIDGVPVTISGIAPPGFFGETLRANPPDFWIPLALEPAIKGRNSLLRVGTEHWLYIIGRIVPGVHPEAIQSRVNVELKQWLMDQAGARLSEKDRKDIAQQHIGVTHAGGGVALMRMQYAESLRILTGISALVLLIACANIANLLLARAASNRIQTSVRLALGAARSRLMRQTVTESVVLALLGGCAGTFVAYAGTRAILLLAFRGARYVPINPDPSLPVLGFAVLLSIFTGLLFGAVPAWIASRSDPAEALRGANRSTSAQATLSQKSLVILQAGLSFVLLCGAGLLTQSLRNLEHQQFGVQPEGRLMVRVNPAFAGYSAERLSGVYQQLEQYLARIPGVRGASFSLYGPMAGGGWISRVSIEGHSSATDEQRYSAAWNRVSPHYFDTVGTPLLSGRAIDERDTPASRHVAVISQAFAQKYFPKENPIGKHFGLGGIEDSLDYEVVGIVGDAKYVNIRQPAMPMFFVPLLQMSPGDWSKSAIVRSNYIHEIQLRIAGRAESVEPLVRRAIANVDPNLSVFDVRNFAERISLNFNQERVIARLTELFGVLALILASVGLYGVTAYSVARRSSEIGVRIALGAVRGEVVGLVLRSAFSQIAFGLLIGIPCAAAASGLLGHQLYQVKSRDPLTFSGAAILLTSCALMAAWLPARRAASIDPMQALRTE